MKKIATGFLSLRICMSLFLGGFTLLGFAQQAVTPLIPVNPGEVVVTSFLEENFFKPEDWTIADGSAHGLTMQREYRMFHGAMFQWLTPPADGVGFSMQKDFRIDASGYDSLVVGAVIPDKSQLCVEFETENGKVEKRFEKHLDSRREYMIALDGAKSIKHLKMSVRSSEKGIQAGAFLWIILQNESKLKDYLSGLAPFGADWQHHLKDASYTPEFVPTYGIVFGRDKMDEIRARYDRLTTQFGYSPYLESAEKLMKITPEKIIRETLGSNIRFARDRDLDVPELKGSELAIAGILTKDKDMLRMAARYAMTLAMTPHWDEGFMAHLPGSYWVHAAFKESWTVHELGIILDLAGEMFTEAGKKFILKRMAIDGIGHINYIAWSAEYIHRMNQMSVFSHGRILAYAILEKSMPRVAPYLDLAYDDLRNSMQLIFLPDGGNVEGPGYMTYTVSEAGLALYYYAMARNKPLAEVIPPNILNTASFAEVMASTVPENDVIPVCDATPQIERVEALSFLANVSGKSRWTDINNKAVARRTRSKGVLAGNRPQGVLSLVIPEQTDSGSPAVAPFVSLPEMGVMASNRTVGGQPLKIMIQGNRARAGHTHEDKGSFVIEFAGEVFAGDFGVAPYGHAMTFITKQCQWHNMLIPVYDAQRPAPANPINVDVKPTGSGDEQNFNVRIDVTPAWSDFFRKNVRSWQSSRPEELFITDDYQLAKGTGVEFYWQTMLPVRKSGGRVIIDGARGRAEITIPRDATCRIEQHSWWDGRTVNRIIFTRKGTSGQIQTKVNFFEKK